MRGLKLARQVLPAGFFLQGPAAVSAHGGSAAEGHGRSPACPQYCVNLTGEAVTPWKELATACAVAVPFTDIMGWTMILSFTKAMR